MHLPEHVRYPAAGFVPVALGQQVDVLDAIDAKAAEGLAPGGEGMDGALDRALLRVDAGETQLVAGFGGDAPHTEVLAGSCVAAAIDLGRR